jgi:uncharacterized repeat protein (TIGR03803 family)
VTFDANGNLLGTTQAGGTNWGGPGSPGNGNVWEIVKGSSTITSLASFNGVNGGSPIAGVTLDANGNLYGTTLSGGPLLQGSGTVWEIAKGSNTITTLASFSLLISDRGSNPLGGVTIDANGNLYGTTVFGGRNNLGTVWKIAKGSNTITTLDSFAYATGSKPASGVTLDANGNLFGTTQNGSFGLPGAVWEIAKGSSTIIIIAEFHGSDGAVPIAGVTLGSDGNLYGTASSGGASGLGTVVELPSPFSAVVPEPSSLVMGLIGLIVVGITIAARRRHCS